MDAGDKQSVTTGLVTILGAVLVPLASAKGFSMTPDQVSALAGWLTTGGAAAGAALGHLLGSLIHKPAPGLPAPAVVAVVPVAPANMAAMAEVAAGRGLQQAAQDAKAPVLTKVPAVLAVLFLVALVVHLTGCKTLNAMTTPAAQPYITAAVDVAVATAETKGVPAAQINAIAKEALLADQGTAATLATVSTLVNNKLATLNLPAGDLEAAQILEAALSVAIQAQIAGNANAGQGIGSAQTAIANVLNAAIAATGG